MKQPKWAALLLSVLLALALAGCTEQEIFKPADTSQPVSSGFVLNSAPSGENGDYNTSETKGEAAVSAPSPNGARSSEAPADSEREEVDSLPEDGEYTTKEDVAQYIYLYGKLPSNFITKKEAQALGWKGGSLEPYAPGKSIGGSHFGNYEGQLPEKKGRSYTECDIGTMGAKSRGAKRIVFSNDGLIYYTGDHYETFTLLYGEE